uniref:Uncharacterized protein n=1 Tax=Cucumis melo TaxID=3656 RepID=A0A9I9CK11_CUCME
MLIALTPSQNALVSDRLLRHSNINVKVAVAACVSEITRIIAPNAPYSDGNMKKALDRGAALLKVVKLATRHNAIDMAETVLLDILRGDIARLSRCTAISTDEDGPIPRCKPFKYTYEKKIVVYFYILVS